MEIQSCAARRGPSQRSSLWWMAGRGSSCVRPSRTLLFAFLRSTAIVVAWAVALPNVLVAALRLIIPSPLYATRPGCRDNNLETNPSRHHRLAGLFPGGLGPLGLVFANPSLFKGGSRVISLGCCAVPPAGAAR